MGMIVSRNYRSPGSYQKWLLRYDGEHVINAIPSPAVVATGVVFGESDQDERGFGCLVVARAEKAEGFDVLPDIDLAPGFRAERLEFDGERFIVAESDDEVPSCAMLILCADGAMFAHLPVEEELPTAQPQQTPSGLLKRIFGRLWEVSI